MQDKLSDVFNNQVSLVDLAKELENDLVIVETESDHFKINFKKDVI